MECPVCKIQRQKDVKLQCMKQPIELSSKEIQTLECQPENWGKNQAMKSLKEGIEIFTGLSWSGKLPHLVNGDQFCVYCPECGFHSDWYIGSGWAWREMAKYADALETMQSWTSYPHLNKRKLEKLQRNKELK